MNYQVAQEIKNQLGNQTLYMLGANRVLMADSSLSFNIKGCKKFNYIQIILCPDDLYDLIFIKYRGTKILNTDYFKEAYCNMLHAIIEQKTGLLTRL